MLTHHLAEGAELRALEPWNAGEFAEHVARARDHLRPWIPWGTTIVDEQTAREFLQSFADDQAKGGRRIYGIWLDGTLVGGTLFRTFDARVGVCEVGVWLEPSATGRGLVTTAVRGMIEWAVCARGMSRVEWYCNVDNKPSIAAAQRLGLTCEGVLRDLGTLNGTRYDVQVWSILAAEWRSRT
ncbi:GNAT family protein [Actinocrispum sp. NPDC049592]|uniref:GNAT family N-acetyltransferase n=1 Tax=Actinocrispum sp. NPDC049592 TaxID=3154835 RepID=UPI00341E1108